MEELVSLVRAYLSKKNLEFKEYPKKYDHYFFLGFPSFTIRISINENGEFLAIYSRGNWDRSLLLQQNDSFKNNLFSNILLENYSNKLSKWSYDPSDGDLVVSIEIPIEDGHLTERQLSRSFDYILEDSNNIFIDIEEEINGNNR